MPPRSLPTLPELGQVVGKYRVVRQLGEGGMGVVYEAMHTRIQQRVAIKMLLPDVLDAPDVISRFEREARAAGKLKSENTTRVLDVDVSDNGLPYMVMEYLDGSDLGKVLETTGVLHIHDAVDVVLQACNAMAEAHSEGVIHRDLKPSNLFITMIGTTRRVKVLDFGISKVENDTDARVTATQTVVGTPLYMSPEQVRSAKHVDARSDIWSLGIILFELIAGRTPFEGSTTAAAAAICIDPPPPIKLFREGVPPELEQAIFTALQKDPALRFQNVQALAAAIAPFGTGSVVRTDAAPAFIPQGSSNPSLPSIPSAIESARTLLPQGSGQVQQLPPREHVAGTMPGWTTRSSPGTRRTRWVVALAMGTLTLLTAVVLAIAWTRHTTTHTVTSSEPARTAPAKTTEPVQTTYASVSTGEALPSASVSAAIPITSLPLSGGSHPTGTATSRPHGTASSTATPPPTHSTAAPSPTRL